jgi:hypothetical protein
MSDILKAMVTAITLVSNTILEKVTEFFSPGFVDRQIMQYNEFYCASVTQNGTKTCPFISSRVPFVQHCDKYNVDLGCDNPEGLLNRCSQCQEEN